MSITIAGTARTTTSRAGITVIRTSAPPPCPRAQVTRIARDSQNFLVVTTQVFDDGRAAFVDQPYIFVGRDAIGQQSPMIGLNLTAIQENRNAGMVGGDAQISL